ncbi:MAG: acetyl-CoA carboxylase biotin carboxyl carrier protein [Pseudomonadota bacterium]
MTKKTPNPDIEFIEALAAVLKENDLAEIEVQRDYGKDDNLSVRVSRHGTNVPVAMAAPAAVAPTAAPVAPAATTTASSGPAASAGDDDPAQHPGAVTSPMVGTVYLQPEPGAPPYVNIGDTVREGQTLLIVEAMKTLNQITAQKAGKVARILVEDATPVEFGSPLMIIE